MKRLLLLVSVLILTLPAEAHACGGGAAILFLPFFFGFLTAPFGLIGGLLSAIEEAAGSEFLPYRGPGWRSMIRWTRRVSLGLLLLSVPYLVTVTSPREFVVALGGGLFFSLYLVLSITGCPWAIATAGNLLVLLARIVTAVIESVADLFADRPMVVVRKAKPGSPPVTLRALR